MKPLPLSPPDCIFLGPNATTIQFLFRFKQRLNVERMRQSFSEVAKIFYPVMSQVEFIGGYPHFVEASAKDEVPFVEETIDFVPDISDSKVGCSYVDEIDSLPGEHLTRIRVTHTPAGSLLGVSISHAIVDGYSYFYFLNSWAAHCRGEDFVRPSHERTNLIPRGPKDTEMPDLNTMEQACGFAYAELRKPFPASETKWQPVLFSRNDLAQMSEENGGAEASLSLNDLLTATLFKRFVPTWNAPSDYVRVACAIDARRLRPDLGSNFFGNAVRGAVTTMMCSDLKNASIRDVAAAIRANVGAINTEAVNSAWSTMYALWNAGGMEAVSHIHVSHPQLGFLVTNMSRLNIRGIDFGSGSPDFVATPVAARRVATILADSEGLSVQVSLPR